MSIHNRLGQALVSAACLALSVTACTSTVAGTPSPAPAPSSSANSDVFAGMNACRILDDLNAGQGFNQGENKSPRNQCVALKPDFASYALALDSVQGLGEFATTNTGVVNISVNGRNAMQADVSASACAVAIEVGEHARALVVVTMVRYSENAQACPNARTLAERVEPLLPKG
ncbi:MULTISPECIES: DUF3558 domain-containing protein [Amycolatopsis]|uniref:DUF3558 domain-containing protein n=1 Tax=Amycolatopsis TaxID=1813 RepID=UPI000B8B0D7B|nr:MULTISPECIES: DUF3558 domain-containing protein [Amycolatopsis]OXM74316.1 DUF3558 domain-containing protein [Amycolatopsis sp. KNN50.9b]